MPQEERIPTEDVPVPPPPQTGGDTGGAGRFVRVGLESFGVLVAVLLAIVVLVVGVAGPAAYFGGRGP